MELKKTEEIDDYKTLQANGS